MRPVDIEADVKEMERRKRVEAIMNSQVSTLTTVMKSGKSVGNEIPARAIIRDNTF